MMRFARTGNWCAALAFSLVTLLSACTEEEPTGIGGDLLPGGDIETFEVILEPEDYLVFDTAFSGYTRPTETEMRVAAREFEGVYNANTIVRFALPPRSISVRNAAGNVVNDTLPRYIGGTIIVRIDTLRSTRNGAAGIVANQTAEEWDPFSATWTMRLDSSGVRLPWSQPGGAPGALLGRGSRAVGSDSISIPIDSATVANWVSLDSGLRGMMLRLDPDVAATAGDRVRFIQPVLRLQARSSIDTDTVVTVTSATSAWTFVSDPQPPAVGTPIRVSGVPAWRTIMQLRDGLQNLEVPCPTVSSTCRVRLGAADITRAELLLRTAPPPQGFAPEDSIRAVARMVLRSPNIPLERSPLSGDGLGAARIAVPAAAFRAQTPVTSPLVLTGYLRAILADSVPDASRPSNAIALMTLPESGSVGFATFERRPRLRLILTVDPEVRR